MVLVLTTRLHDALADGKIPAGKVFIGMGTLVLLLGGGLPRLVKAWQTVPMRAFVGLTVAVIVSVPFAYLRSLSLETAVTWMTTAVPITVIIATSVQTVDDLERLLRALVLAVICAGIIMLAGLGVVVQTSEGNRLSLAGAYDPNDLACVISGCTAACLWALRDRSRVWRVLGLVGLALAPVVIAKTGSRGGLIAIALLVSGGALFVPSLMPRWSRLALIPAALIGLSFAPDVLTSRLSTLSSVEEDYNFTDRSGRIQIWARGLGYIAARPITGVGAKAFRIAEGRYAVDHGYYAGFKWMAPHNLLIECAAELGVPGLIALLVALLSIVRTWRRVRKNPALGDEEIRWRRAVEAIALVTLTFLAGAMFVGALWNPLLQMLVAMSVGAHMLLNSRRYGMSHG